MFLDLLAAAGVAERQKGTVDYSAEQRQTKRLFSARCVKEKLVIDVRGLPVS